MRENVVPKKFGSNLVIVLISGVVSLFLVAYSYLFYFNNMDVTYAVAHATLISKLAFIALYWGVFAVVFKLKAPNAIKMVVLIATVMASFMMLLMLFEVAQGILLYALALAVIAVSYIVLYRVKSTWQNYLAVFYAIILVVVTW